MGSKGVAKLAIAIKLPITTVLTGEWCNEGEEDAPASVSHDEMPAHTDRLHFFSLTPLLPSVRVPVAVIHAHKTHPPRD